MSMSCPDRSSQKAASAPPARDRPKDDDRAVPHLWCPPKDSDEETEVPEEAPRKPLPARKGT